MLLSCQRKTWNTWGEGLWGPLRGQWAISSATKWMNWIIGRELIIGSSGWSSSLSLADLQTMQILTWQMSKGKDGSVLLSMVGKPHVSLCSSIVLLEAKLLLSHEAKRTAMFPCDVKKVGLILQKNILHGDISMPFPEEFYKTSRVESEGYSLFNVYMHTY